MDKQKIYFPNLNGLRFIAALLVIIHHIEQIKSGYGIQSYYGTVPFIFIIGKLGVNLFFVLSGFLITYLLLTEERKDKKINVRNFYIRRILRIWPLYYLIIILALLIIPNISLFTAPGFEKAVIYKDLFLKIVLYVFFLPNLVLSLLGTIPYASQTWSIGTEEQFYLLWPLILTYFKKRRILIMIVVVLIYHLIPKILSYISHGRIDNNVSDFWILFNINSMAIGGFFAVLLFQQNKLLKIFMNRYLFYGVILLAAGLITYGVYIPRIHTEFYASLFGIIILNFAANDQIIISLNNRVLNYLGKISYGLYMFHPICIVLALTICKKIHFLNNWVVYPLSVLLTIFIAGVSYRYYESWFLKFKSKFSVIQSGDNP